MGGTYNVHECVDDVALCSDDGAVIIINKKAVEGGGACLDGGGGGGGGAESMRESVEETARGHEELAAGDGEVEEGGGSVFLFEGKGGVKSFAKVGNSAGVGDEAAAVGVVLGDEAELT